MQYECANSMRIQSYFRSTPRDDFLPNRYRYRMRTTIGSHAGESTHTEMQFYRPHRMDDDGGWEPPWLPLRTTLRCTPPKHDSIRCGAYAPKHDSIRCGAYVPKRDSICCALMRQSTTLYAAVLMRQARLYMLRCLRAKARLYAAVFATKALRTMLRCLHTNALWICCGYYTKALRNSYGGVYCISTEVLRPEVSDSAEGCRSGDDH